VGNKIRNQADRNFITAKLSEFEFLGFIPYDTAIIDADITNTLPLNSSSNVTKEISSIYQKLLALSSKSEQQ
jgi:CO dehydrogenase maturation factor